LGCHHVSLPIAQGGELQHRLAFDVTQQADLQIELNAVTSVDGLGNGRHYDLGMFA
jgi:hypothetical protein